MSRPFYYRYTNDKMICSVDKVIKTSVPINCVLCRSKIDFRI